MKSQEPERANGEYGYLRRGFIVWIGYQRRAEVLAPLLRSEVRFFPHKFQNKALRPLDYAYKLILTVRYLLRTKPSLAIFQVPPSFAALAAVLTKTPYLLDVHNALVQSFWSKIPLNRIFIDHAVALIAHNEEIATIIKSKFPSSRVFTISDPLEEIGDGRQTRDPDHILFICSLNSDEPIELILNTVRALPEFTFSVTGNPQKLPREIRAAFEACPNARLTGFLKREPYQALLCSSTAAVVLTTWQAAQSSGACEALSSDTPLVLTRTSLNESLFGGWAKLVENNTESLVQAIRSLSGQRMDLQDSRDHWNENVVKGIGELENFLTNQPAPNKLAKDRTARSRSGATNQIWQNKDTCMPKRQNLCVNSGEIAGASKEDMSGER